MENDVIATGHDMIKALERGEVVRVDGFKIERWGICDRYLNLRKSCSREQVYEIGRTENYTFKRSNKSSGSLMFPVEVSFKGLLGRYLYTEEGWFFNDGRPSNLNLVIT